MKHFDEKRFFVLLENIGTRNAWKMGVLIAGIVSTFSVSTPAGAERVEVIAGAGPSTIIVSEFVKFLASDPAADGYLFEVPRESAKHAGGIRNTGQFLFGRTGRPLTEEEKSHGVEEIFLARVKVAFVRGGATGVSDLSVDQVCGIFTGRYTNWKDVGGNDAPITVITREKGEALFRTLREEVPCMNNVVETLFVLKKDHHVLEMLKSTDMGAVAIGFGAASNYPKAAVLNVEGFDVGVPVGLVFSVENANHPLVDAAREIVRSDEWEAAVAALGALPIR